MWITVCTEMEIRAEHSPASEGWMSARESLEGQGRGMEED